jgi:hypothetical protein
VTDAAGHCSFCGTTSGPFATVEGLFTVLICIPCLEVRQAQPDTRLSPHNHGHAISCFAKCRRPRGIHAAGAKVAGGFCCSKVAMLVLPATGADREGRVAG